MNTISKLSRVRCGAALVAGQRMSILAVMAVTAAVGGLAGCADPLPEFQPQPEPPPRPTTDLPPLDATPPSSTGRPMDGDGERGGFDLIE